MKKLIPILFTPIFLISKGYAAQLHQIKTSTTTVLKRVTLNDRNYSIGIGVGAVAPNSAKPWKSHSLAEVVYIINGKAIVNYKPKLTETYTTGESYQIKTDRFHQTQSGDDGLTYVVIWGERKKTKTAILTDGTPLKPLDDKLQKITLEKINHVLNSKDSVVKKTSLKMLEEEKIPQSPYTVFMKLGTLSKNHDFSLHQTSEPRIMYLLSGEMSIADHSVTKTYHCSESFIVEPNVSYQITAGEMGARYILGGAVQFR